MLADAAEIQAAHSFFSKHQGLELHISISIFDGLTQRECLRVNEKKALLVITDGEDNCSHYTFSDIKEFASESDALIYLLGEDAFWVHGRHVIREIARLTGGLAFFPRGSESLDSICEFIRSELRNQYLIGFIPSNTPHDGKWRKLKIRVDPPKDFPKLTVRTREGYFTPKGNFQN